MIESDSDTVMIAINAGCPALFTLFSSMHWPFVVTELLAQTPSPIAAPDTDQVELLKQQIEFLQDANDRLANSFGQFVTLLNTLVVIIVTAAGILGFKSLQDIKKSVDQIVKQEVGKQIARTVQAQVDDIDRVVQREAVVGKTQVAYLWLNADANTLPTEYQLLKARGFQMAAVPYDGDRTLPDSHVIVLDLINSTLSPEHQDALITTLGNKVLMMRPYPAVLVIYVRGQRDAVNAFPKEMYYVPANGRGTLIGAVTSAAQAAYALRRQVA